MLHLYFNQLLQFLINIINSLFIFLTLLSDSILPHPYLCHPLNLSPYETHHNVWLMMACNTQSREMLLTQLTMEVIPCPTTHCVTTNMKSSKAG